MNYLLDRYLFGYLPFEVSDELKKSISSSSMSVVKIADWFCKTQDIHNFFENHFTFFSAEILYFFLFIFTLFHAFRLGGRFIYTWLGIFMLVLLQEIVRFWQPVLDIQWHAQGLLSFCGGRIPISRVLGAQQVFIYSSYVLIQRMHFSPKIQSCATAIGALILKLPYDFIGTHFLWWTLDFNNPLIQEKVYGVPWIVFAFDVLSTSSFVFGLTLTRKYLVKNSYNWKMFVREFICVFLSALNALFFAFCSTLIIYYAGIYTNVSITLIVLILTSSFVIDVYIADRRNKNPQADCSNIYWFDELSFVVCIHFIFLMTIIVFYNPIFIISRGFHKPIGPCQENTFSQLPFDFNFTKSSYFCLKKMKNEIFDFHCIPSGKPEMDDYIVEWYTICGKLSRLQLYSEYIALIWSLCFFGSLILFQAAALSGRNESFNSNVLKKKKKD